MVTEGDADGPSRRTAQDERLCSQLRRKRFYGLGVVALRTRLYARFCVFGSETSIETRTETMYQLTQCSEEDRVALGKGETNKVLRPHVGARD